MTRRLAAAAIRKRYVEGSGAGARSKTRPIGTAAKMAAPTTRIVPSTVPSAPTILVSTSSSPAESRARSTWAKIISTTPPTARAVACAIHAALPVVDSQARMGASGFEVSMLFSNSPPNSSTAASGPVRVALLMVSSSLGDQSIGARRGRPRPPRDGIAVRDYNQRSMPTAHPPVYGAEVSKLPPRRLVDVLLLVLVVVQLVEVFATRRQVASVAVVVLMVVGTGALLLRARVPLPSVALAVAGFAA